MTKQRFKPVPGRKVQATLSLASLRRPHASLLLPPYQAQKAGPPRSSTWDTVAFVQSLNLHKTLWSVFPAHSLRHKYNPKATPSWPPSIHLENVCINLFCEQLCDKHLQGDMNSNHLDWISGFQLFSTSQAPFFFFRQTLMKTTNLIFKNGSKRGSSLKQKLGPQALHSHYHLGLLSYLQGIPRIWKPRNRVFIKLYHIF